jgi:quercetin dioxygenase-like cupin family protein
VLRSSKILPTYSGCQSAARNYFQRGRCGVARLGDDPWLQVKCLLPDTMQFDFAVNTMTYHPGAALSMVEAHWMEHGLLMLEGGGIYRLGDAWYPGTAGEFIWMAPWCPQWFGAIGKTPAKYILYKDWNRHLLAPTRVSGGTGRRGAKRWRGQGGREAIE